MRVAKNNIPERSMLRTMLIDDGGKFLNDYAKIVVEITVSMNTVALWRIYFTACAQVFNGEIYLLNLVFGIPYSGDLICVRKGILKNLFKSSAPEGDPELMFIDG